VVLPDGKNFETQLIAEGYLSEIEAALNTTTSQISYLDDFIQKNQGLSYGKFKDGTEKGTRDYRSAGGRERAVADAMKGQKTRLAKHLAYQIVGITDPNRRFPTTIAQLFKIIGFEQGVNKAGGSVP
jgi:putative ATP-dependent endonuclease of the OLD family